MNLIQLGAFALQRQIGKGAMGEVWEGRHAALGTSVAVKVVTQARARDELVRELVQQEIRAVAGLDHPGIVRVYDADAVDVGAEAASGGRLVEGSPWYAMELAQGGSLHDSPPSSWMEIRRAMVQVLEALAHAHARGVIHRDLKPGNVMRVSEGGQTRLRLCDFGLSYAVGRLPHRHVRERTAGTPTYMPPEQILGRWRDFGPWTDLYALGTMAWEMVTGRPPYRDENTTRLFAAKLAFDPPPLRPRVPVPEGFEAWLRGLLAREVQARYRRAADARQALLELGDEGLPSVSVVAMRRGAGASEETTEISGMPSPLVGRPGESGDLAALVDSAAAIANLELDAFPTLTSLMAKIEVTVSHSMSITQTLDRAGLTPPTQPEGMPFRRASPPPLPRRWQEVEVPASRPMVGVGLGLFGLRPVPLVDRNHARDQLWSTLRRVSQRGRAQAVVVVGGGGGCKTGLARWLCRTAHELGAVQVFEAHHGPFVGPLDALPRMLLEHFQLLDLPVQELRASIAERLQRSGVSDPSGYKGRVLTDLCFPNALPDFRTLSDTERHVGLYRVLHHAANERPVLVWLDDVHWGASSLAFVEHALELQGRFPAPVLFVLTVREDALSRRPVEEALLERLSRRPECAGIELSSLIASDHAELVEHLLRLEPSLAEEVERRTAGNPLFAVQLVGDWVQRGVLEHGEEGFRLRHGADASVPDELHYLWRSRIDRLLVDLHPDAAREVRHALEVAAALGQRVLRREWEVACELAGVRVPRDILDAMARQNLVRLDPRSLSFAHGMLRESLERDARETERWPHLHRVCAEMLRTLYPSAHFGVEERRGRHLLDAGACDEAFGLLLGGAEARRAAGDFRGARDALELARRAASSGDAAQAIEREIDVELALARTLDKEGLLDDATEVLDELEPRASHRPMVVATAGWLRGMIARKRGDNLAAIRHFQRALDLYVIEGDATGRAACLRGLGEANLFLQRLDQARMLLKQACALYEKLDDPLGLGWSQRYIDQIEERERRYDAMEQWARRARASLERAGDLHGLAWCHSDLGLAARGQGDLERASEWFLRAVTELETVGTPEVGFPRLYLASLELASGRFGSARRWLEKAEEELEQAGRTGFVVGPCLGLLACDASEGRWEQFDARLVRVEGLLAAYGLIHELAAFGAAVAARVTASKGEVGRTGKLLGLAVAQLEKLGVPEEAGRLRDEISGLLGGR